MIRWFRDQYGLWWVRKGLVMAEGITMRRVVEGIPPKDTLRYQLDRIGYELASICVEIGMAIRPKRRRRR